MFDKLLCKIFGHKFKTLSISRDSVSGCVTVNEIKCTRCGEVLKMKEK